MISAFIVALGAAICLTATCGPAHAETTTEAALTVLCGPRAAYLAPVVGAEAHRWLLHPVLVVVVIAHESHCRADARSGRGDYGLGQIRVGGSAAHGADVEDLLKPDRNLELTARHLAGCLTMCGGLSGLSVYSGHRRCGSTRYSRAIVDTVARFWRAMRARAERKGKHEQIG
jgi:hypothetical protein